MSENTTTKDELAVPDVGLVDMLAESSGGPLLNSELSQSYLSHLTSLPLETLLAEPSVLQTQSHHLTSSLTSLTHTSYPTFLSLHSTTKAFTDAIGSLSFSLNNLINLSLPALEESAAGWRDRTENVLNERRKARVVLDQHEKLRDLLDIPVLIDTCVRNGYFSEALSLASHATSISSSGTPPPVLASVLAEVQHSIAQMLLSLLTTLHEPNRKLPALWKAVNFLRKMDAFDSDAEVHSEEQIALAFIGGREACLKSNLEGTRRDVLRLVGVDELSERDAEDLTRYLKKYIDMWREGTYDIITQFSTIFLERPPTTSGKDSHSPSASLHRILSTYASHSLQTHLIPLLRSSLSSIPLPSLPSLLTQLTYCANAFGRVGFDFRGVLSGLFSTAVLSSVTAEIRRASHQWSTTLKEKTGSANASSVLSPTTGKRKINLTPPSKFLVVADAASVPATTAMTITPPHVPPHVIASYPPLAEYTNALLTTLNNLRLLAPTSIQHDLQSALDDSLKGSAEALFAYIKQLFTDPEVARRNKEERQTEEEMGIATGEVFFGVFVPFVRRAVGEGVFGVEGAYQVSPSDDGLGKVVGDWDTWVEARKERQDSQE